MQFKPLILTALIGAALTGCSTLAPMDVRAGAPASPKSAAQTFDEEQIAANWNEPSVLAEGRSSMVLLTPYDIPSNVRAKNIALELEPGATVGDLVAVMGKLGVPAIVADAETADKTFYLPRYKGTVGGLLSAVSRATDVWFTWSDGTIIVSNTEKIGVSMPQEAKFAEQLDKGLDAMGVKEKSVSWHAGMATMELKPSQFHKVKTFLERLTANAAIVNLQVAVVNVTLNQSAKQGIDWEKLSLSVASGGSLQTLKAWQASTSAGTSTGTGTTTTTTTGDSSTDTSTTTGNPVLDAVAGVTWAGSALQGAIFTKNFSFSGLFNFLQTYGDAETKQHVILKTVGGNKVEFKSVTQIPYVSGVSATTTSSNNSSVVGSSTTDKADDGITVEMLPMFDSAANTVTVDLKLSIKAVVAFNELSAGNQLGKFTQPTVADRSFTDTLKLRPGQTVVVGGLTYDSVSNSKGAPVFLQGSKLESQSLTVNRQSMFIVLRPTVAKLGQVLRQASGDTEVLDLLPASKGAAVKAARVTKKSKDQNDAVEQN